jgi:predicted permease
MSEYIPIILPIYIPIVLGFMVRSTGYFDVKHGNSLLQFALKITVPLLIFTDMAGMDADALSQVVPVVLSLPLYMLVLWLAALLVSRIPLFRKRQVETVLIIILGNIGYFGWAVCEIGLGSAGLSRSIMYAVLFWPLTILFSFLTKILLDRSDEGLASALYTLKIAIPIFLAFVAGLAMAVLRIHAPDFVMGPLAVFGKMTVPLILFGVGLSLSFKAHWGELSLLLPLRLVLTFGAAWLTTRMNIKLDEASRSVIIMVALMPVAANSLMMGNTLKLDEEYISGAIMLSSLIALVTIPLTLIFFS